VRARYDLLTGLANRVLLQDRIEAAIALAGTDTAVWVAALDLDHFKYVNDTLGHGAGDEMLKAVAARLQGAVGRADTVARTGGDEFVLVLPGRTDESEAATTVQAVLDALAEPLRLHGQELVDHGQRRPGRLARRRQRRRGADPACRGGDVPRQGPRPQRGPVLHAGDECAGQGAPGAGRRAAQRADAGRVRAVLPAPGRPAERLGGRAGGADPLAPPEPGHGAAGPLHPPGRGDRADRADRRLGAAHGLPPEPRLGARRLWRGADRRQPVGAPVRPARPGTRDRGRADRYRA
jgi:diguanylate cyclase (GGDEF)-like protein